LHISLHTTFVPVARISIPTQTAILAPLLIDGAQLKALDELIDRYVERLRTEKEARIAEVVEERIREQRIKESDIEKERASWRQIVEKSSSLSRDGRYVTIYLSGGRAVRAQRFNEAINHPVDEKEIPTGFRFYLRIGEITAEVKLSRSWRDELTIGVEPSEPEAAQEVFGALRNWGGDVAAPKWQQYWSKARPLVSLLLFMWLMMGLVVVPLGNWGDRGKNAEKAEARKLVASGINDSNQRRALELLLAIDSEYDPGVGTPPIGAQYWIYFALGAVLLSIGSICPRAAIGVWKGRERLKLWRFWVRTVSVSVPAILVTSFLVPWLLHWLRLSPPSP
jgi:hypothetical protein